MPEPRSHRHDPDLDDKYGDDVLDDEGFESEATEDDDFDDLFKEDPDARRADDLDEDGDWS